MTVYGIGRMLPVSSSYTCYLDHPGTPVVPTLKNGFFNALDYVTRGSSTVRMTLSMGFPDFTRPDTMPEGVRLADSE